MITHTGTSEFRGRVGLVIEVAPNMFATYVMTEARGTLEINAEVAHVYGADVLTPIASYSTGRMLRIEAEGPLIGQEFRCDRPAWMTAPEEIEARRELGGR